MISLNILGTPFGYYNTFEIFIKSILGMFLILLLALIYNYFLTKIIKRRNAKIEICTPIYNTRDVLLQEKNIDFNRINSMPINYQNEVKNSVLMKVTAIILILIFITTPILVEPYWYYW